MKILHIVNSLRGGGIQNFLLSLAPEQVTLGHEVTLVCIEKYDYDYCKHLDEVLTQNGVKVICLKKIRHNKMSMMKTLFSFVKLIRCLKPDIVNTHGQMSHLYGVVSTYSSCSTQIITVHNAPEHWDWCLNLLCCNKPIIFCSRAAYDMREQKNKRIIAIDNGISRSIIHSEHSVDLRKELGLNDDEKIVVLVGSLRPQKNYEFLKEIIEELKEPSIHFCVCGGNYGVGYISMDVFKGYPQIHCLGLRSDVSAIENGADLFLSCAKFEGLPIAVLEAYFNGIPCVLSPIPQHEKIADVYKVWLPKKFDAASFSALIKESLMHHEDHNLVYKKRKEQIERYSISRTTLEYLNFYEQNMEC